MNSYHNNFPKTCSSLVQSLHTVVKGRARYKITGLQGSREIQQYLEFKLSTEPGVFRASASPVTGNILVLFHPDYSPGEIANLLTELLLDYRNKCRGAIQSLQLLRKAENFTPTLREGEKLKPPAELWHLKETDGLLAQFNTSKELGLSHELAEKKLRQYGLNTLPEPTPRSGLSIFIDYFKSVPVALLSAAAGVSLVTGGIIDALVIMGVVAINAALGYATESQSERIIHSLKNLVKPSALVLREGNLTEVPASEIVLGDILILRPGSYVAADARLIVAHRLTIDESTLTGESLPVKKTADTLSNPAVPLAERTNMVYMGTLVTGGQGLAVVVGTGELTEMGRIQTLVGETVVPQTPMERQLDEVGGQLVLLSGGVCGLVFTIGLLRGYGLIEMLKSSISLAVAAVPEGLPTVATTTLALGIWEMRKRNVLIRRLEAVEALGSVQTICLDKTGTLTANQMSVVELSLEEMGCVQIAEGKLMVKDSPISPEKSASLLKLIEVSVLCNSSEVSQGGGGEYVVNGSATENALIYLAIASGVDVLSLRQQHPLVETHHRSESQNFMRTVHLHPNSQQLLAVKGNPMEVLDLCQWQLKDQEVVPLTDADRLAIEIENERMAAKALRVLGAAYNQRDNQAPGEILQENLIWLGLIGMADPLRTGVKGLMGEFHQAGIDTVMITGDQSPTAYAIGKELNLSQDEPLKILDSTDFADLEPEVMKGLCERVHVFARISPAHKLQIVQSLQRAGKVVAMTGDGINDAPALKAAEVGIAMGHGGTDVAREVADVVLEDDNLATMIVAVSQGRTIYSNIRKSVHFLLSTNLSEIVVMFAATTAGMGQPLNAMQLLWLNLVTDIFPGLALALEAPEPDVLLLPPRPPDEPILKPSDFKRITLESTTLSLSTLAAYGYGLGRYGISPRSSTIAFMSLVMGQLFHAISCRSEKQGIFSRKQLPPNPYLTIALGGSFALQLISLAIPGLRSLLKLAPISLLDSSVIATSALLPLVVHETAKQLPQAETARQQEKKP
jgi:Ca2+-transporting ATPase